jgi:hypothetical protein
MKASATTVMLDTLDAMAASQVMRRLARERKTAPGDRDLLDRVSAQLFAAARAEMTLETVAVCLGEESAA